MNLIKCWSCDKSMTLNERSENDGNCIYCGVEIEMDLDFRRANNIFEVGDLVVTTKKSQLTNVDEVGSVSDINSFGYLFINGSRNGYNPDNFRHATTEEIKAGKRL